MESGIGKYKQNATAGVPNPRAGTGCHQSVEKLSSTNPVPGAKKVGDRCATGFKRESDHIQLERCRKTSHKSWHFCWSWRIVRILTNRGWRGHSKQRKKKAWAKVQMWERRRSSQKEQVSFKPAWFKRWGYISRGRNHARNWRWESVEAVILEVTWR